MLAPSSRPAPSHVASQAALPLYSAAAAAHERAPHAPAAGAAATASAAAPAAPADSRNGLDLDLAYEAIRDRNNDDLSGSTPAQLQRAAAALGMVLDGPASFFHGTESLSAHSLRRRAAAQFAALTGGSKAHKADPMSRELFETHPWPRAGAGGLTKSAFFAMLPSIEREITEESTATSHGVNRVRTLAAWHVEHDCPRCVAAAAQGGDELCSFWEVARQLVDFAPPLRPGTDITALGVGLGPPDPVDEAVLKTAKFEELRSLGVLEVDPSPGEDGSVFSSAHVVHKIVRDLDGAAAAAVASGNIRGVATAGLARGVAVTQRARELALAAHHHQPSASDYSRAATEVAGHGVSHRVVLDLTSSGLNDATADWPHTLPSVHEATDWLPTDEQLVNDVVRGYYAVRIRRSARKLFKCRDPATGIVYRFCRLVMGGKVSSSLFCVLSGMIARRVQHLCSREGIRVAITTYIDDFLFRAHAANMSRVDAICAEATAAANISFSEKKRQRGKCVTFCGARASSDADGSGPVLEAKHEHLFAFCESIGIIKAADDVGAPVPAAVFEYTAGIGQFIAGFVAALKPRLGALCFAGSAYGGRTMLRTDRDGISDSVQWIAARASARGFDCYRRISASADSDVVRLFSDSSGVRTQGAGAIWRQEAIYRRWTLAETRNMAAASTLALELDPVLGAFRRWGHRWRGRLVTVYIDNLGAAYCVNAQRAARGSLAARRIVELFDLADEFGFEIIAIWLPRRFNRACDAISKQSSLAEASAALSSLFGAQQISIFAYDAPA